MNSIAVRDGQTYFRFGGRRAETGVPAHLAGTVECVYEVGPLTADEIRHIEACEEYGATKDVILSGLDLRTMREVA